MENYQQEQNLKPLRIRKQKYDGKEDPYKELLSPTYKKDEIILFFDKRPSFTDIHTLKKSFGSENINPDCIEIRECKDCRSGLKYVQLWQAENIHTVVNTEGVRSTTGSGSGVVGERYSLNFYNNVPFDKAKNKLVNCGPDERCKDFGKKSKVLIAVLDTGIDTNLVSDTCLWKNDDLYDKSCYKGAVNGWNFIDDCPHIHDDHPNKHGSIVSQFIINEFEASAKNYVQLMVLKTHGQDGRGDLFGIICALHFAIAKGAKIINASWGFYYYYEEPIPYLSELINVILKKKEILFVTAAGNQTIEDNNIAREIYRRENGGAEIPDNDLLRNLEFHSFYPARLSGDNNVITVTTNYEKNVSPTQNYSDQYVDLGVMADQVVPGSMKFWLPFPGNPPLISGSSFATAIATGKIGAYCDVNAGINKTGVITQLESGSTRGTPVIFSEPALEPKFIKKGRYTKRTF